MKIGLLSDTHGYLDPVVFEYFKDCDELWHAGDVGDIGVLEALEKFKPLHAVFGNIDDAAIQNRLREDVWLDREGVNVWMTHIGGAPPNYNTSIKKMLKQRIPDVFVCGHSHILRVHKDEKLNMLYINPGAAGQHGFHTVRTVIRIEITDAKISKMEVIELGKRGR